LIGLIELSQLGKEDELKEALTLFGDDINQADQDGHTALTAAAVGGHLKCLKPLLQSGS